MEGKNHEQAIEIEKLENYLKDINNKNRYKITIMKDEMEEKY